MMVHTEVVSSNTQVIDRSSNTQLYSWSLYLVFTYTDLGSSDSKLSILALKLSALLPMRFSILMRASSVKATWYLFLVFVIHEATLTSAWFKFEACAVYRSWPSGSPRCMDKTSSKFSDGVNGVNKSPGSSSPYSVVTFKLKNMYFICTETQKDSITLFVYVWVTFYYKNSIIEYIYYLYIKSI